MNSSESDDADKMTIVKESGFAAFVKHYHCSHVTEQ